MPVREAFRQLEAAGLIVSKIHKGAIVTSIPSDQILELFELRALLECEILQRAIPNMTAETLKASGIISANPRNRPIVKKISARAEP